VEIHPPGRNFDDPHEIVEENLAEHLKFIEQAGDKGVDIIVFPEATLNYEGEFAITFNHGILGVSQNY
jgi:hypothetical protein